MTKIYIDKMVKFMVKDQVPPGIIFSMICVQLSTNKNATDAGNSLWQSSLNGRFTLPSNKILSDHFLRAWLEKSLIHFQSKKSHCSKTKSKELSANRSSVWVRLWCTNDNESFQKDVKRKNSLLTIFIFSFFSPGDL